MGVESEKDDRLVDGTEEFDCSASRRDCQGCLDPPHGLWYVTIQESLCSAVYRMT